MSKPMPAEHYRYAAKYQHLQKLLSSERFADVQDRSLAFWVMHSDRRLPQAFLRYTLAEVLGKSYDQLAATGGVGRKKMGAFLRLLSRIAERHPGDIDSASVDGHSNHKPHRKRPSADAFDPDAVSEAMWSRWGQAIRQFGAEHELLGRLAPSLQMLPSVIWRTSLGWYLSQSLAEVRSQKTHGEKRVRIVLEVVHGVYDIVSKVRTHPHLSVRLTPGFVPPIEQWIWQSFSSPEVIERDDVHRRLISPLAKQIEVDCGAAVAGVVACRLPLRSDPAPVNSLAKRMGVTRARVYQLIEECEQAMEIRWPEGRCLLSLLDRRLTGVESSAEARSLLRAASAVFFPDDGRKTPSDAEATLKNCLAKIS